MTSERPSYHGDVYVTNRPDYPARVYDILNAYHAAGGGQFDKAVDVGCGPGFMALELTKTFQHVSGLDPDESMVAAGLQPHDPTKRIAYAVGTAERLDEVGVADQSVDLVVAGEAAHYFDHSKTWPELARVLKPRGTVAWIDYGRLCVLGHDDVNAVLDQLMSVTLGPYFSQPGWSISESLLDMVPFPVAPTAKPGVLSDLPDLEGEGHAIVSKTDELPPITDPAGWDASSAVRLKSGTAAGDWFLRRKWTLAQLEGCIRTWSSVKRYHDQHPDDKALGDKGDVVGRAMAQIAPKLQKEFEVAWPFVMMMIRRQ